MIYHKQLVSPLGVHTNVLLYIYLQYIAMAFVITDTLSKHATGMSLSISTIYTRGKITMVTDKLACTGILVDLETHDSDQIHATVTKDD